MRKLINLQKEGNNEKLATEHAKKLKELEKLTKPDRLHYYQELYQEAFSREDRSD